MGIHPAYGPGYQKLDNAGLSAQEIYASVQAGDVKALYVLGADPVGDRLMADRGQLDFMVVQELFLTETAVLADVVLPAQSWAEREGTFTSGERRVQRYYPAIPAVGESRADWQILGQIGERLDMGKPAIAASLFFRDVAKAVPQYKAMDYRSLARVEDQWPIVGGEDLYYGGTSYKNEAGLGQQWASEAESGDVAQFDVPDIATGSVDGLQLVRTAALYTSGTLINHSNVLAPRMAQPTLSLHADDAATLRIADGNRVNVTVADMNITAQVHVNGNAPAGVALLCGVPYQAGAAKFEISKVED
jgi:NADH-quinone oxidoreductase subunit G